MYLARRHNANFLAWTSGSGDLRLPDAVQTKAQLSDFIEAYFKLRLPDSYYVQIYIHTAGLNLIMIVGFLTIFKRVREGKFSLFRVLASTDGATVIVPHSTNCLLFFDFFFGAIWIAFEWIAVSIFHSHISAFMLGYWLLYPWLLVWFAAWLSVWGMFHSIPSLPWRQQQRSVSGLSLYWRCLAARASNAFLVMVPVAVLACTIAFSIQFGRHYETSDELRQALQFALTTSNGTNLAGPEEKAATIEVWENFKLAWWWGTVGFCEWTAIAWLTTLFQFIVGVVLAYELIVRMRRLDNQENDDDLIFSVPLTEPFPVEVDDEEDNLDLAARLSVPPPAELGDKQRESSSTDVSAPKDGEGQTPDPNLCSTTTSPSLRMPVDRLGRHRRVQSSVVKRVRNRELQRGLINLLFLLGCLISALTAYSIIVTGITAVALNVISKSPEAFASAFYHYNLATGWLNILCGGGIFLVCFLQSYENFLSTFHSLITIAAKSGGEQNAALRGQYDNQLQDGRSSSLLAVPPTHQGYARRAIDGAVDEQENTLRVADDDFARRRFSSRIRLVPRSKGRRGPANSIQTQMSSFFESETVFESQPGVAMRPKPKHGPLC
ncbi:hypothetical protein FA10DRAFT_289554 [Acaromyces ingoldii]|uniref:Uncharacterized protein n=1 Tax=Acaromyces ingoldii TaxID=215250 RepID=A0A316YG52_9BASI|nr:hypothetical protein FA10DRAFT_289554 [Acaromyces ingoldii]PWN86725.1 hypothetical protein FA10DRAFT_289554 [Acaromyces ingoldii]